MDIGGFEMTEGEIKTSLTIENTGKMNKKCYVFFIIFVLVYHDFFFFF